MELQLESSDQEPGGLPSRSCFTITAIRSPCGRPSPRRSRRSAAPTEHQKPPGGDCCRRISRTPLIWRRPCAAERIFLCMAVPSVFVRSTARRMKPLCKDGQIIVNVAKGIEENTLKTMSEIIEEELPECEVAVLSGPSHAEEVSRGIPTTCVAGLEETPGGGGDPEYLYEPGLPRLYEPGRPAASRWARP